MNLVNSFQKPQFNLSGLLKLPLMSTSAPNLNPYFYGKRIYANLVTSNNFKVMYADRNDSKAVIPFLDSLSVPYLLHYRTVLVKHNVEVLDRLVGLGFSHFQDVFPKTPFFVKELVTTSSLSSRRMYHKEYGIELHLIDPENWGVVVSARKIVDDMQGRKEDFMKTFISVHNSLLRLLTTDRNKE